MSDNNINSVHMSLHVATDATQVSVQRCEDGDALIVFDNFTPHAEKGDLSVSLHLSVAVSQLPRMADELAILADTLRRFSKFLSGPAPASPPHTAGAGPLLDFSAGVMGHPKDKPEADRG